MEVLLVEDNAGDVALIREAFKESGVQGHIHVVPDGKEALRYLRREGPYRHIAQPHLVLLNLDLAGKNGCDVLTGIKGAQDLRHIPVLVMSHSARDEDIRRAYDLHANCYLQKPTDREKVRELGRHLHAFWLGTAALPPRTT